jgi:hypothetical protein
LIFAHLAVIDADSLALAAALILLFFFGAAEFFPEALAHWRADPIRFAAFAFVPGSQQPV